MRFMWSAVCVLTVSLAFFSGNVVGQDIEAQIQKTTVPPVIDGVGNDPIWTNATAHGADEFFNNVSADQATIDSRLAYSFEVSFPWEALEETPANIIANGEFGFGVQVNDSDLTPGTRETWWLGRMMKTICGNEPTFSRRSPCRRRLSVPA